MVFDMEKPRGRESYNLLIGLVAPRPIALVTSMNEDCRLNAAPFSSYNYLCTDPPIIGMGVTNRPDVGFVPKDTASNIRRTEELHAIGRMNGLGSYVKTRDSFLTMPRISYEEWKAGKH